jgi:hypothetical protein
MPARFLAVLAGLAGLAVVAAAVVWSVLPAAAHRAVSPCSALPGEGWRAEVVPPMPRAPRGGDHAANRAFVGSGLWQLVVVAARTEQRTLKQIAVQHFGPEATVLDLQRVAWRTWTEVDASRRTGISDAQGTTEPSTAAGDHLVCIRPLTEAERDPDGVGGAPPAPPYVVEFSDNPVRA